LLSPISRSNSVRASSTRPLRANALTSQNEQARTGPLRRAGRRRSRPSRSARRTRAAVNRAALDPLNLEVVAEAAVEAGASPSQLQTLVAAAEDPIEQPPLSQDAESLRAILLGASRYNLTDLADAAQAALDALGAM
jgi:hypothetical protein